jgi:predicted transcriptional regulator
VRKRGWGAISIDILEATLTPEKKMRIMYRANLNFDRFNRYFYDLLNKGFIEKANDPDGMSSYKISERGKTLLAALRKAQELASSERY